MQELPPSTEAEAVQWLIKVVGMPWNAMDALHVYSSNVVPEEQWMFMKYDEADNEAPEEFRGKWVGFRYQDPKEKAENERRQEERIKQYQEEQRKAKEAAELIAKEKAEKEAAEKAERDRKAAAAKAEREAKAAEMKVLNDACELFDRAFNRGGFVGECISAQVYEALSKRDMSKEQLLSHLSGYSKEFAPLAINALEQTGLAWWQPEPETKAA
jgi:hypothetical protein